MSKVVDVICETKWFLEGKTMDAFVMYTIPEEVIGSIPYTLIHQGPAREVPEPAQHILHYAKQVTKRYQ